MISKVPSLNWVSTNLVFKASIRYKIKEETLNFPFLKSHVNFFWPSSVSRGIMKHFLPLSKKEDQMARELDQKEIVYFHELLTANTIQIDTMYQLMIQKGFFTEAEFFAKMKEVQQDYHRKQH